MTEKQGTESSRNNFLDKLRQHRTDEQIRKEARNYIIYGLIAILFGVVINTYLALKVIMVVCGFGLLYVSYRYYAALRQEAAKTMMKRKDAE